MKDGRKNLKSNLTKFLAILGILVAYTIFISTKYGLENGLLISGLTWSFFVLCTPIADAGFLLDFPIRLISNIKMLHTEILVWFIAIALNLYVMNFNPEIYQNTMVLKLFEHILTKPYPYWSIILISAIGTFVSIHFGDSIVDELENHVHKKVQSHHNRYQYILMIFFIGMAVVIYKALLEELGMDIPL